MLAVHVDGIGVCGPGLSDWESAKAILAGAMPYVPTPVSIPALALLPPAERRRVVPSVRIAMAVAQEGFNHAKRDASTIATVFATTTGDGETLHGILDGLTSGQKEVSPIRFHNSVHNAPSGYWAIATRCREPSTTVCAHNWSFAAGLLEAAARVVVEKRVVALIAHDQPNPEPLATLHPIQSAFGVALILSPNASESSLARIEIEIENDARAESRIAQGDLERLRLGNSAARSLPLLRALALRTVEEIILSCPGNGSFVVRPYPIEN